MRSKGKKKNLRGHFWELSDELLDKNSSVYRYCIYIVYILCNDFF